MSRRIPYIPKITGARTQYREISPEDHAWLQAQMMRALVKCATLSNTRDEDQRVFRNEYWRKRRANLPRGRTGMNTPESLIGGILDNMLYAEPAQRDFSDKQMDALEDIFNWLSAVWEQDFEEVRFQIGFGGEDA
ncbi:hypothetical protein UFOVP109_29 [uncultured Caudovirales phage]|uniref:Uncharacterized protein n=1 Tax=uncultured Caudovirales phage TaxID=2100421 RepID=A0A6J7WM48_9CAUD|nr:hypothetical protein UFOVP109_29 [uncultured Caudovirales phage]CAB5218910.1 hypothetical protein UFOVP224_9 [uncultured Caudovirales phage]